jgi:GNAT superfamily N-acetyltransferase
MRIEVRHESARMLGEYSRIPISFSVSEVFDVAVDRDDNITLTARRLADSYVKDYDAIDGGPERWPHRFNISNWVFLAAFANGQRIGGATVAHRTSGLDMLEDRDDLAVIWDIRVVPPARGAGAGAALFGAATAWAQSVGCRHVYVETQNTNVNACRFYARQGCVLMRARWGAYPQLPHEVQLLWHKDLAPGSRSTAP